MKNLFDQLGIDDAIEKIIGQVKSAWSGFFEKTGLADVVASIPEAFSNAFDNVKGIITSVFNEDSLKEAKESISKLVDGIKDVFSTLPAYVEGIFKGIKEYLSGLKIDLNPFDGDGVGVTESISLTAAIVKAVDKTNGTAVVGNATANAEKFKNSISNPQVDNVTARAEKFKDDVRGAQVDNVTAIAEKFKNDVKGAKVGNVTAVAEKFSSSIDSPVVKGARAIATSFSDSIKGKKKHLGGFSASVTKITITGSAKAALRNAARSAVNKGLKGGFKAKGGVYAHGRWRNIPQYAGGTLDAGSLFVAGEAGPEIVGHVGGRTEVLNQSQIASAIYSAMTSAMSQQQNGPSVVQVVLDGRVVAESSVKEWQRQAKRGVYPLSSLV